MTWRPVSGQPVQYSTANNEIASGYYIKFYSGGGLTPISMATDFTGGTTLAKAKLNTKGYPISNPLDDTTVFIPHVEIDYRIVLYKNEADADNNATANAEWNIPWIERDTVILGSTDDIVAKGTTTTLQMLDDYDRSPLFVDGTDFTAGAGPHVITTPAWWNPTNSDMRFWRVASNGVVTELTPTVKTSSSFTLSNTLLSTDVIFIGDDTFRNQFDGDPADIRTRLSVYSQAQVDSADNLKLTKASNLSDLANAATARTNLDVYSKSEADTAFLEDTTDSVTTSNILNLAVTEGKLANNAVASGKLKTAVFSSTSLTFTASEVKLIDTGFDDTDYAVPICAFSNNQAIQCTFYISGSSFYIRAENLLGAGVSPVSVFFIAIQD